VINEKTRLATRAALKTMRSVRPADSPDPMLESWDPRCTAVWFWRAFVEAGGLQLDPALWNLGGGAAAGVAKAVESALVNGWDSSKASAVFLFETPERHDWLRVDDGYEVAPCYYLEEALGDLFMNEINRSLVAVQVLQGIAGPTELDRLDKAPR